MFLHHRSRRISNLESVRFLFSHLSFMMGAGVLLTFWVEFTLSKYPNYYIVAFVATLWLIQRLGLSLILKLLSKNKA